MTSNKGRFVSTRAIIAVGATACLAVGLAASINSCSDQPKPLCSMGHGQWAITYTPYPGQPDCPTIPKGEMVGAGVYYVPRADQMPDFDQTSIALQPIQFDTIDQRATDPDPKHVKYSWGKFVSGLPDPNTNFCFAPSLSPAQQVVPYVPAVMAADGGVDQPEQPAANVMYEWSNLRVYVTAAYQGTQLVGDVTITTVDPGGVTCRATYHAVGLWPGVACTTEDDCSPLPNPDAGRRTGSGINPDIAFHCDVALGQCVLNQDPPSLRPK